MPLMDSTLPANPARAVIPMESGGSLASLLMGSASVLFALVSLANLLGDQSGNASWPYLVLVATIAWLLVYVPCAYRKFKSMYLFSNAYLLTILVFHFSHIVMYVLGVEQMNYLVEGTMSIWYERASWYVSLAIACFGIGMALSRDATAGTDATNSTAIERTRRVGRWAGWGLLCASIVALGMLVVSVGNIFQYSRMDIYGGIGDSRGLGFLLIVLPSALLLLICTANTFASRLLSFSIAGACMLVILFLGERSAVLFPGLVAVIVWRKMGGRVPLRYLLPGLAVVLLVIPAIRELRTVGPYSQIGLEDVSESFRETQAREVFLELGSMHGLLANVILWVPESDSYRYGMTYVRAMRAAVPNLGLAIRRSDREQIREAGNLADAMARLAPSDWYIFRVNRWIFDRGGGAGFSSVAEAYLNFGTAGVGIIFALTGMLFGKFDSVVLREHPGWLIAASVMCWPLLKIVRNDFETLVKPVSLILFTLAIWWLASRIAGIGPGSEDRALT